MDHPHSSVMDEPAPYRIRVYGCVSEQWIGGYWDLTTIVFRPGTGPASTVMVGEVTDQAALIGLINMLYDLGHAILSVERLTVDSMRDTTIEEANS